MSMATTSTIIKIVGTHVPAMEVVSFRYGLSLVVLFPILSRYGWSVFRTPRPGLHLLRIVGSTISILCGIYAFTRLPLATAVCLTFTRPLFMIVLALLFLGERVRWRRGLATVAGFIGVLIVAGPSDVSNLLAILAGLGSAAAIAGAMALVRQQAAVDSTATIMAWNVAGCGVLALIPTPLIWQTPQPTDLSLLIVFGLLGTLGQYMMIRAFVHGESTVVNPIDYGQIIVTTIIGYMMFGEVPTIWTVAGAAIIIASTLYIVLREAKLRKLSPRLGP